jgi:deoxyribose-phosphate aldolase
VSTGRRRRTRGRWGTRSIKNTSKAWAVDTAISMISMIDLTTLEGADTEADVRSLCAKAMAPDPAT